MKYTGVSIGPIYKTLSFAKKTAEIWISSYIFSFLMKNIIKNLIENGINKSDFLTPYVDIDDLKKDEFIGKYHDRFIYKGEKEAVYSAIEKAIDKLSEIIENDKIFKLSKDEIKEDLKKYFRFFVVEIESNNPLKEVNEYLNSQELNYKVYNGRNIIEKWIKNIRKSKFKRKVAGKFKSLPSIALSQHSDSNVDEQKEIENLIKQNKLKPYQKYIAIVHADGDNLSKLTTTDISKIQAISKKLFEFSNKAVDIVNNFNAQMVYAGGDDLLFFAPVFYEERTIFDLIYELKKEYETMFENKTTLSFGVSISYFKYPLNEALKESRELLFYKAKKNKNSVAFYVTKHSGQRFGAVLEGDLFEKYCNFIKFNEEEKFLHSLYSKIAMYEFVLKNLHTKERLMNFFDNYFNEAEHKSYKEFFEKLSEFILDSDVKTAYATLRFMKFLKGER